MSEDDTLDELGVLNGTTSLCHDFDQVKVHIFTVNVGNMKNRFDRQICVLVLAAGNDLGAEGSLGAISQVLEVVLLDVYLLGDLLKSLDSDVACVFESISYLQGVDTLVEELLGLLEDGSSEHDYTSGTITDFVVLGGTQLNQKPGSLVVDLHLFQNGSSIVGDDDLTIWGHKHLVHALGSKRCLEEGGNGSCSKNVDLKRIGYQLTNHLPYGLRDP